MEALLDKTEDFVTLANKENKTIASGILTLQKVVEYQLHFNIPIYQRLYVWKINQIRSLLEDIKNAFEKNINYNFFLGGVMLSNNSFSQIDLVDGQQRFTTLWLICDVLSATNNKLRNFTYTTIQEPRIYFSIRKEAQRFLKDKNSFKEYLNDKGEIIKGLESEVSEIIPLVEGQRNISEILNEFQKDETFDINAFSKYIYSKINLTYTFIPGSSDMNRVFEAMNNRGKQLEHHELLKSRLLEKIPQNERLTYALLWDACADMNNYIEKSIKDVASLGWKDLYRDSSILYEDERTDDSKLAIENVDIIRLLNVKNEQGNKTTFLQEILKDFSEELNQNSNGSINENEYSSKAVRSIISYPVFLLQTLRIYQLNNKVSSDKAVEVNEKKLLKLFDVAHNFDTADKVKEFIGLLWKVRVCFDKYVIKWVYYSEEKEEFHEIESIQVSKSVIKNKNGTKNDNISVQRIETTDEHLKGLIKLQGMLYHSQEMTTQYWLTPFLYFLVNSKSSSEILLKKLEVLENVLFYSSKNTLKLKYRTYQIVFEDLNSELESLMNTVDYLSQYLGTSYPNYIFYKLEYVLWKNRVELCSKHSLNIEKWNNFRLTAKNSVEHIFPQNQKDENRHIIYISEVELHKLNFNDAHVIDDFGNLVLLSPGMNSEYSNMPYQQKKGKYDSKTHIDSLKSDLIFRNTTWDWSKTVTHRNEMISLINSYISQLKIN